MERRGNVSESLSLQETKERKAKKKDQKLRKKKAKNGSTMHPNESGGQTKQHADEK